MLEPYFTYDDFALVSEALAIVAETDSHLSRMLSETHPDKSVHYHARELRLLGIKRRYDMLLQGDVDDDALWIPVLQAVD